MTASDSKTRDRAAAAEPGGLTGALERAFRELPAGSAESRLTQYCGRVWDVLRGFDFVEAYRNAVGSSGPADSAIGAPLTSCLAAIATLVTEGIEGGEFCAVSPRATARLLVSSLFARAHWCRDAIDPMLSGSCSRAVAETLELVRPALSIEE